jgi:hypothetical protein
MSNNKELFANETQTHPSDRFIGFIHRNSHAEFNRLG